MYSFDQVRDTIVRVRDLARSYNRTPNVFVTTQIVCRPTRKEAEDYLRYYAAEMADADALEYLGRMKASTASTSTKEAETAADRASVAKVSGMKDETYPGLFPSMYPIVGAPDDIVEQISRLADLGVAGSTLVFLNYLDELPYFVAEVLPRLERARLRGPQRAAA
jgi:FMNH2-dependent dimethyl sulfone monooxygenase